MMNPRRRNSSDRTMRNGEMTMVSLCQRLLVEMFLMETNCDLMATRVLMLVSLSRCKPQWVFHLVDNQLLMRLPSTGSHTSPIGRGADGVFLLSGRMHHTTLCPVAQGKFRYWLLTIVLTEIQGTKMSTVLLSHFDIDSLRCQRAWRLCCWSPCVFSARLWCQAIGLYERPGKGHRINDHWRDGSTQWRC